MRTSDDELPAAGFATLTSQSARGSAFPRSSLTPARCFARPLFSLHPFVGSPLFSYAAATLITGAAILGGWAL